MKKKDSLDLLGIPPSEARVIRYFLLRPEARTHLRELQRTLGLGGASVQRAVERLLALGALEKIEEGRRTIYAVVLRSPVWSALQLLVSTTENPSDLVRAALVDVSGIEAAFIFGSAATGGMKEGSDVDILIVEGAQLDRQQLYKNLAEVSLLLGREVNPVRYSIDGLAARLGDRASPAWGFVHNVLSSPKEWIVGESALAPVAIAGGISREVFGGRAA